MSEQRSLTILHLSDLQFGRNHRFGRWSSQDPNEKIDSLLGRLGRKLTELRQEHGLRPDLLVLTGDMVETGMKKEFDEVLPFVEGLTAQLDLTRERVVIVPGNHDINWAACEAHFNACKADDQPVVEPYSPKWRHFAAFFETFFRGVQGRTFQLDQPWSLFEIPELQVVVAGLNSTWKESHRNEDHYGWLGEHQLQWFEERLQGRLRDRWFRIGAVHHNVDRKAVQDDENLRDADDLKRLLAPVLNLLLHGHTHEAALNWLDPKIPILATGSASVSGAARPEEVPNQLQFLRIRGKQLERWTLQYDPRSKGWIGDNRPGRGSRWHTKEEVAWHSVHDALPSIHSQAGLSEEREALDEERGRRDLDRSESDDFFSRVRRVCSIRNRDASIEERYVAGADRYLRVAKQESTHARIIYPLGVFDNGVDLEHLDAFVRSVVTTYRWDDPGLVSEAVYGGEVPAPSDVVRRAEEERIRLFSFIEYQGIWDARGYLRRQTERLQNDPIYPPSLYVPQRMQVEEFGSEERSEDALDQVRQWLESTASRFVLLLGEFGTGKTFLLHELARRLGVERHALVPVLIEMRWLEKGRSLEELIAQHLAREKEERIDLKAFRYMLESGRIVLLFDGYDELALRVTYDRAVEHFQTLLNAYGGAAKVVVTSRTQHFENDRQIKTELGRRVELLTGGRMGRLERFGEDQIRAFLVKKLGSQEAADARFDLIREIQDLEGLSANPRMLGFIADLDEKELRAAKSADGRIDSSQLYAKLLEKWLTFEVERHKLSGHKQHLTLDEAWKAVTSLALRLWRKTESSVLLAELQEDVALTMGKLEGIQRDVQQATHAVGSGTLLVRDEEGNFSFLHQSVMEWLVARELAPRLQEQGSAEHFGSREISGLMADFLLSLAGRDSAVDWARRALTGQASEAGKKNANVILKRAGAELEAPAELSEKDLRGQDFTGQNLFNTRLVRADLTDACLQNADLRGADLEAACLERADLRGARLDGARLDGAVLYGANLIGARLAGASLYGTDLRRAKLLGVEVAPLAMPFANLEGAALQVPNRVWCGLDRGMACQVVAWSPHGRLIAMDAADGAIRVCDSATGRVLRIMEGHIGSVWSVVFSPDGRVLASGGDDRTVRLWEVASGKELRLIGGHTGSVWSVAFSPDGRVLASGGDDRTVRLWEVASGEGVRLMKGHADWVRSVAFSPDGHAIASGGDDRVVRLWEVASGKELRLIGGHRDSVRSVAFSPDGHVLAGGGSDQTVRLWEVASGNELRLIGVHKGSVWSVAFSPDGQAIASGGDDGAVRLWEVSSGKELRLMGGHEGSVRSVAFSPDGRALASGGSDQTVRLWEAASGKELRLMGGHTDWVRSVAFSPGGSVLASGGDDRTVCLWEVATGKELRIMEGHTSWVWSVAFSPDGRSIASGGGDRTVRLWEVGTSKEPRVMGSHTGWVWFVAFSPDGRVIASGGGDRTVRLWEVATGKELAVLASTRGWVTSLSFSPSGNLLVGACVGGSIAVWSVRDRTLLYHMAHLPEGWVAFSPEGLYKFGGRIQGSFWHAINLCRFEPGELDEATGRTFRLPDDHLFVKDL